MDLCLSNAAALSRGISRFEPVSIKFQMCCSVSFIFVDRNERKGGEIAHWLVVAVLSLVFPGGVSQ